jgi:hypothetical protein
MRDSHSVLELNYYRVLKEVIQLKFAHEKLSSYEMDNLKGAFLELENNLKFKEKNMQESKGHPDDLDVSGSLSDYAGADEELSDNNEIEAFDDMLDLLSTGGGGNNGN